MNKSTRIFLKKKQKAAPITVLTAYDYPSAKILDEQGIDIALVGDSVGTTMLGYSDTTRVTMDDMLHHTAAVARAVKRAFILADMPIGSYATKARAIANARRLLQSGAHGVKLEGGKRVAPIVRALHIEGINVCGHIGYLPQSISRPGVVGKLPAEAKTLFADAFALQQSGAFMIVIELVPKEIARAISNSLKIPTIGIGAGPDCDGQVQVFHDMVGLSPVVYRHAKAFAHAKDVFAAAVSQYVKEVTDRTFPTKDNSSSMPEEAAMELASWLSKKKKERKIK
jgi:3-methyl-2-oxobutanoate hydroxymethyltransferase